MIAFFFIGDIIDKIIKPVLAPYHGIWDKLLTEKDGPILFGRKSIITAVSFPTLAKKEKINNNNK